MVSVDGFVLLGAGGVGILVAFLVSVGYATVTDARARGHDYSVGRGALVAVVWPMAVNYWARQDRGGPRTTPPTTREHVARAVAVATASAGLTGSLLAPPDPVTHAIYITVGTVLKLPFAYLLVTYLED